MRIERLIYWTMGQARHSLPVDAPLLRGVKAKRAAMATEAKLLTVQFLKWVAERPRTHADARDAWSSTCPLNCAWEDAVADDLVRRTAEGRLQLTKSGRA